MLSPEGGNFNEICRTLGHSDMERDPASARPVTDTGWV